MKVIDLLNKIANGEEVPKEVKYKSFYWKYSEKDRDYKDTDEDYVFSCSNYDIPKMLNNEVKIIEEEPRDIEVCGSLFTKSEYGKLAHSEEEKKIPEKLGTTYIKKIGDNAFISEPFSQSERIIVDTINALIEYLKSKGE